MQYNGLQVHASACSINSTAFEFIKTNIIGSQNIIESCIDSNVSQVLALSTDKASSPVNLYGATKLCSDKLFTSAQNIIGKRKLNFSVVRYGNVMFSRGSIIPKLLKEKSLGHFSITDPNMTRFSITLKESVNFVLNSLVLQKGGEIFVPKIPSYRLLDLCKAIDEKCKIKLIGVRQGEKIHEELISNFEARNTLDLKDCSFEVLDQQDLTYWIGIDIAKAIAGSNSSPYSFAKNG
jgi:FlaA1/EpsC-like NDP-sugar epimerase